ncbi:MAG: hypothetical protein SAJ37_12415, partial [Oscillatoria sp. PMC 1068.18]|nr:hypothetical protein [Oscillatoria sp. PMC 1068.18]
MKRYLRYLIWLIAFFCLEFVVVALFNLAIDPFAAFGSPMISGVNQLKLEQQAHVRLFKAIAITRLQPKTILLGSSRTDLGLNPDHQVFANKSPVYNLGVPGVNMYEVRRYFEHALQNQPEIKQVVLGIDFLMFNQFRPEKPDFSERRLNLKRIGLADALATTFSLDAVTSSWETIQASKKDRKNQAYSSLGMRNEKYFLRYGLPKKSIVEGFKFNLGRSIIDPEIYYNYALSEEQINDFKTVVNTCKKNNLPLKVFISPSHATQWKAIELSGLWDEFEQWKQEIVKITSVWDFSGYNSVTTEPISDKMKNYLDNSHYSKAVGNLVLNRIFQVQEELIPADFGVLINSQNV